MRRSIVDLDDLRRQLEARAPALCAALLPRGRRDSEIWRAEHAAGLIRVTIAGARAGHWMLGDPPGREGDALELVALLRGGPTSSARRGVAWARRWLAGADDLPARPSEGPQLCPHFFERAGSRFRPLGTIAGSYFYETPLGSREAVSVSALRWRATFDRIFAGDRVELSRLFPPRHRREAFDLELAQRALIAACASVGVADPACLGIAEPPPRRRRA